MWIEILIACILGLFFGTITGLTPGIHVNLVAITFLASSALLLQYFPAIIIVVFLVAMSITHTFMDVLPAIFLGMPEEETALSVLPGHELLIKGQGYEAVRLTVIGSLFGLFVILFISPLYIYFLPKYYSLFQDNMAYLLIAISGFLILKDKKKVLSFLLFMLSGVLGILALGFTAIQQPLVPLLSSLFGTSLITISFLKKVRIPKQTLKVNKKIFGTASAIWSSMISGSLVSFLPGLGAAQGAVIGSSFTKLNRKAFLILLGAISTITMGLGFTALYVISKPRHGVAVVVGKFLEHFTLNHFLLLLSVMLFTGGVAVFLTLAFAKLFARKISGINYQKLSSFILLLIVVISILVSGWMSLLVLVIGTAIGITASLLGVRKMHLMGCLIIPVIFYFLL